MKKTYQKGLIKLFSISSIYLCSLEGICSKENKEIMDDLINEIEEFDDDNHA